MKKKMMIAVVVLVGLNLWLKSTRDIGPDPALEALHSSPEAIHQCQEAINARFASQRPNVGLLAAEYLQGGEYEIRGSLRLRDGRREIRYEVVCVAQFDATGGWDAEEISLEPN
jgi:hypothetical protein